MTFEEMQRTFDFILQHEAQTSVHLQELATAQARHQEFMTEQAKRTEAVLEIQSRRLDRAEQQDLIAQQRHEDLLLEIRAGFDRIIEKISDK
jgi:hypothetical protein